MTVTIYGMASSSNRKAKQWLEQHGIPYVERNILKQPLTKSELQNILRLTVDGTDEIISTRSKHFKKLNLSLDDLSLNELLTYIHQNPRILKTPIIIDEKRIQVGFREEELRQFIPREKRKYQWLKWQSERLGFAE